MNKKKYPMFKSPFGKEQKILNFDITINNTRLARIEVTNENFELKKIRECRYTYRYIRTIHPVKLLKEKQIVHNRDEGMIELIRKVIYDILEKELRLDLCRELETLTEGLETVSELGKGILEGIQKCQEKISGHEDYTKLEKEIHEENRA